MGEGEGDAGDGVKAEKTDIAETNRVKQIAAIILIALLFWHVFSIAYFYLHEYGHYAAGLIENIPAESMTVHYEKSLFYGIIPYPTRIDHPGVDVSKFFKFFGGFVSGTIMLTLSIISFILHRRISKKLFIFWTISAITLGFALFGYTESIIEPLFPKLHRQLIEQLLLLCFIFILPGSLIFYKLIVLPKDYPV